MWSPFKLVFCLLLSGAFVSAIAPEDLIHPHSRRITRTKPPVGSVIVNQNGVSGEFKTVQAAINSLPSDNSAQTIFIFPGTFTEQVIISRPGMITIMGSTNDTTSYKSNTVTIQFGGSASINGTDPASATLQVNKANFALYNVNLRNTFGQGSQALAVISNGNQQGYYGVAFFGWQDTISAETGNQFFGHCYIEGAVDFIFGQHARAFFTKSDIASVGAGCITANGRNSTTDTSFYVINESNVFQSPNAATSLTGKVFLGRPWGAFARVAFTSTNMSNIINSAGWKEWSTTMPNTANATFIEFDSSGAGASGTRAPFSQTVSSDIGLDIVSILGSNFTTWVDTSYL